MTNPGRLLPVLFFSLLSFWPSFCFSDFLISTIHYPLLVLWADVQRTRFLSHELEVWVPFQQRLGRATQGNFSPAWKFLGTIVAVVLRNVRLNQLGTAEMFSDPCGKVRKATEYLPLPRNHLPSFLQENTTSVSFTNVPSLRWRIFA